jgi:hypothetical protein
MHFHLSFNTTLEEATREAGLGIRGTILHKSVQILAYAGNIAITERYGRAVKEAFIQRETAAKQMGLMMNYDKMKYVELSYSPIGDNYIITNNHNIEKVIQFKYQGPLIANLGGYAV